MWGKIANTINTVTSNIQSQSQPQSQQQPPQSLTISPQKPSNASSSQAQQQLKRCEKLIRELQTQNINLKQDMEFMNKAYEQLEKEKGVFQSGSLVAYQELTNKMDLNGKWQEVEGKLQEVVDKVVDTVLQRVREGLEQYGEDTEQSCITIDCKGGVRGIVGQWIQKVFGEIRQQQAHKLNQQIEKDHVIQSLKVQIQIFNQEIGSLRKENSELANSDDQNKKQLQQIKKQLQLANQNNISFKLQLQKKQKKLLQFFEANKSLNQTILTLQTYTNQLKHTVSSSQSQRNSLKNMVQQLQAKLYDHKNTWDGKTEGYKAKLINLGASASQLKGDIEELKESVKEIMIGESAKTKANFLDLQNMLNQNERHRQMCQVQVQATDSVNELSVNMGSEKVDFQTQNQIGDGSTDYKSQYQQHSQRQSTLQGHISKQTLQFQQNVKRQVIQTFGSILSNFQSEFVSRQSSSLQRLLNSKQNLVITIELFKKRQQKFNRELAQQRIQNDSLRKMLQEMKMNNEKLVDDLRKDEEKTLLHIAVQTFMVEMEDSICQVGIFEKSKSQTQQGQDKLVNGVQLWPQSSQKIGQLLLENNTLRETIIKYQERQNRTNQTQELIGKGVQELEIEKEIMVSKLEEKEQEYIHLSTENIRLKQQIIDLNTKVQGYQIVTQAQQIVQPLATTQEAKEDYHQKITQLIARKAQLIAKKQTIQYQIQSTKKFQKDNQEKDQTNLVTDKVVQLLELNDQLTLITQNMAKIESHFQRQGKYLNQNSEEVSRLFAISQDLESQISTLKEIIIEKVNLLNIYEGKLQQIGMEYQQKQMSIAQISEKLSTTQQKLTQQNQAIAHFQSTIDSLKSQIQTLTIQLQTLGSSLSIQVSKRQQAQEDLEIIKSINEDFESKSAELASKQEILGMYERIGVKFRELFRVQGQEELSETSLKQIWQDIQNLQDKGKQLQIEKNDLQTKLKQLQDIRAADKEKMQTEIQNNLQLRTKINQKNQEYQRLSKEIHECKYKIKEGEGKYLVDIQEARNKSQKQQTKLSKMADRCGQLQKELDQLRKSYDEKCQHYKNQIGQDNRKLNNQIEGLQKKGSQLEKENTFRESQMLKYQKELQKVLVTSTKDLQTVKKQSYARIQATQQMFKAQKISIQKKKNQQLNSYRQNLNQKSSQLLELKQSLLLQKQSNARLSSQLNTTKSHQTQTVSLQQKCREMKSKLQMKDEEMKKVFVQMQGLKTTIGELQEGIETYQAYAEEKGREVEGLREEIESSRRKLQTMEIDRETIRQQTNQKRNSIEAQNKFDIIKDMDDNQPQHGLKNNHQQNIQPSQSLVPIKNLFMRYFQSGTSFQHKVQTLHTLCEVLNLNEDEKDTIDLYKKHKLQYGKQGGRVENKDKDKNKGKDQALQNKLFSFLTSD